jgi:anti-anti-sigma regulatory factor
MRSDELRCVRTGIHALLVVDEGGGLPGALRLLRQVRRLADDGVRLVVVDLTGTERLDGAGVASLLRCRRVLRARAGTLVVRHPPAAARAMLVRSGLLLPEQASYRAPGQDAVIATT